MSLLQELRYAARVLAKAPGFTAIALLTLALAIGANTAIFSVIDGVLLKPLPLAHPQRLMEVMRAFPDQVADAVSVPKFVYWRDHNRVFSRLALYDDLGSGFNLASGGPPERIVGARVSRDFFAVLGVRPRLGRDFLPEEDRPGARRVVVLSHGLWSRRYGADPGVVGRQTLLNGDSYTVVGVMPPGFRFPRKAQLWTPCGLDPASQDKANIMQVVGLLAPGIDRAAAKAGMDVIGRQFLASHPEYKYVDQETVAVTALQEYLYGGLRTPLLVLAAAVGCVLLIACANIANLQLARAAGRQREIAIRAALGAGSLRIARQLLVESLLLGLAGGAAGLLLGAWSLGPLLAASPVDADTLAPIGVDGRVLAFTLALSLLSVLLFGLVPALQAMRGNLHEPLKEGSTRSTGGARGQRTRRALVAAEVAIALVLITGAALLARSFVGLTRTDLGFAGDHVLTVKLSLPESRYGSGAALARFADRMVERVASLPGVERAALATSLPLEGGPDLPFTIEGRYRGGGSMEGVGEAQYRAVTPEFFRLLRIPRLRGRAFAAMDGRGAQLVAVVNQTAARRYWPKEDPIGRRITLGQPAVPELADPSPRTIVGVVGDVREQGVAKPPPPIVYVPLAQMADPMATLFARLVPLNLAVRTAIPSPGLAAQIERRVWAVDPQQPVTNVATLDEVVARSLGSRRFTTALLGLLAALALLLAGIGIYGVLSHTVHQRTREIGVRMALGADAGDVLRMVIRQGLTAVLIGVALGVAGALGLTRLLGSLLYGVGARDLATFALTPLLLTLVALLAAWLPARRASRLDPVVALGEE
ncbi:MAG TPA: ABC transporter permease [Thermoanaerobaculia bacterium]|nr:ABC transporter permease [Thermoanaerobaculia bacterium]